MEYDQLSIFDCLRDLAIIERPKSYHRELVNYCEFDKFASKSYSIIHNVDESMNLGDITKVDEAQLPSFDLMTYGFPCQSFSMAGKRLGFYDPDKGDLFFHSMRIAKYCKPKFMIAENVKGLVNHDNGNTYHTVIKTLESLGYNNYAKVLNTKDYGIPQNRERIYIVSIRKDIDNGLFQFPKGFDLELRLKDMLEECIDEKYYLSEKMKKYINSYDSKYKVHDGNLNINRDVAVTLNTRTGNTRADCSDYLCDDLPDEFHICGVDLNHLKIKSATSKGYETAIDGDSVNLAYPESNTRRGRVGKGVSQTLTTSDNMAVVENLRIRKLTPKECWRLQGFDDSDIDKCVAAGLSDTQLYKQAGNSITVDVLHYMMIELHRSMPMLFEDLKVLSLFSGIGAFEKALERLYANLKGERNDIHG